MDGLDLKPSILRKCLMRISYPLHLKAKLGENVLYAEIPDFRERRCAFPLDFRPFRSLVLDEARNKAVLRGEGYAWIPIWWSSDNSKK